MSLPLLSAEDLQNFLNPLKLLPLVSGIQTEQDVRLQLDIAVGLFGEGYEVRLFPCFTEASAQLLKDEFTAQVNALVAAGKLDEVAGMPVSLEDMCKKTAREFNAFPIWRIETFTQVMAKSQGYKLVAMRYMPDPALGIPCVMGSFEKEGARNIDIFLLSVSLTPRYNAVLNKMQQISAEAAAAARVEAVDEKIEAAGGIVLPDSAQQPRTESGLITGTN